MLTTSSLRGMLEDAWDAAPEAAATLREGLRGAEKATRALVAAGSIQSVNKNTASQSYAFAARGTATTLEIADGWRKLVDLYDSVKLALESVPQSAEDEDIYPEMMARLQTDRAEYRHNYSCLRA